MYNTSLCTIQVCVQYKSCTIQVVYNTSRVQYKSVYNTSRVQYKCTIQVVYGKLEAVTDMDEGLLIVNFIFILSYY